MERYGPEATNLQTGQPTTIGASKPNGSELVGKKYITFPRPMNVWRWAS